MIGFVLGNKMNIDNRPNLYLHIPGGGENTLKPCLSSTRSLKTLIYPNQKNVYFNFTAF